MVITIDLSSRIQDIRLFSSGAGLQDFSLVFPRTGLEKKCITYRLLLGFRLFPTLTLLLFHSIFIFSPLGVVYCVIVANGLGGRLNKHFTLR